MHKLLKYMRLLFIVTLSLSGCGTAFQPEPTPTQNPNAPEIEYTITMDEFRFSPDHIRLVVGQDVTLHVVNKGQEEHEIMIGRNLLRNEDGTLGDGFEHDFFALTNVTVPGNAEVMGMNGEGMNMEMDNPTPESAMSMTATPSAEGHGDDHGEAMANGGMVMLMPENEASIYFKVTEEMVGTWTMGCFEGETPRHFDLGMAGILYVRNLD
ncbi:MAG: hypothetical protein C3F07_11740 [Anaerolineales bacterium]|nr:MAG: hypothetical protein C3F07_11740 [Anaerolineales bacterium]